MRSRNAVRRRANTTSKSAAGGTAKSSRSAPRGHTERAKPEETTIEEGSGNVYLDVGFPPAEAESLLIRTQLTHALDTLITKRKLTQTQAGRLLGVSQPRVSDVIRGRIERFTIDALVEMLARAGVRLEVTVVG